MLEARQVADYFLCLVDRDAGDTISNLKLQKLVYYAQAWSLALRGAPAFGDRVEAWVHGPVIRGLYEAFEEYNALAIPLPVTGWPILEREEAELLMDVWGRYGDLSARQLEHLVHREAPWVDARLDLHGGEHGHREITPDSMQRHYGSLLSGS